MRLYIISLYKAWLRRVRGIAIAQDASASLTARFVSGAKGSITISSQSHVAFKALLVSVRPDGTAAPITILPNCFIGGGATILPGVTIGPNAIIGAGAVVFEDVPPYAIAVGNPARVIATNPAIGAFGRLPDADANTRKYWQASS